MNNILLEVIVSTFNDGILSIKYNERMSYLVIHQVTDLSSIDRYDIEAQRLKDRGIRYIRSYEIGLSKSRNLGLMNAIGQYIWIMDDDVVIYDDALDKINKYVFENEADLFVLNYTNEVKVENKNIAEKFLNSISVASVSSINMLIKKESIGNILFDERFGLGSNFPSGEEYIFCCDMLKQGKKIQQTNLFVSYHPPITSGQDFYSTPNKLATKKYMFRRAHGTFLGQMLYMLFVVKKAPILFKNKALINSLRSLFI